MNTGWLWASILAVLTMGCQSSGALPHGDDGLIMDREPVGTAPDLAPVPPPPPVSFYPELDLQLSPILAAVENARSLLRPDSGSVAADSAFLQFRREFDDRIRDVVTEFDDQAFQADVWPTGAAAMARWRADQRPERRATPEEEARADSIVAVLMYHGVWIDRVEGDIYFSAAESMVLDRLGPFLTHGLRDFLENQADEQRKPVVVDAALMIPLDELTRRLRWAEAFLEAHPQSVVLDVVESRYRRYLAIYLAGLPNTPAFDRRTGELEPDWRESMLRYATNHAGTESGTLVSRYLNLLEVSRFQRSAEIDAFLSELWADVRHKPFPHGR
jgi:hypothetical protein